MKKHRFIKIYDGIRYLVLFCSEKYNAIYDRINYLISKKNGITNSVNHNFARIKIDSCNSLPMEKTLTFHNVIILIKVAETDMRYFTRSKFSRSLVRKKNFSLI